MIKNEQIIIPYAKIPRHVIDKLKTRRYVTECEMHILIAITLKTVCYPGRFFHNFSYQYLADVTEFNKKNIVYAIKDMLERNILKDFTKPGAKINCYGINENTSEWLERDGYPGVTQEIKTPDGYPGVTHGYPGVTPDGYPGVTVNGYPGVTQDIKININKNNINKSKKDITSDYPLDYDFLSKYEEKEQTKK